MLNYTAMYHGDTELSRLYSGGTMIWEKPAPAYDETKIALVELDEYDRPTSNVSYFSSFNSDFWAEMDADQSKRYWVRVGADSGITSIANQAFGGPYTGTATLRKMTIEPNISAFGAYSFANCSNLNSIEFSSVATAGDSALARCTALTSVDLVGCTFINSSAFEGCTALSSVTLHSGLTFIGNLSFKDCTALASIEIPSTVTTIRRGDAYNSFKGCTNLTQIIIHKPAGSISGAPWGAANATVTWTG